MTNLESQKTFTVGQTRNECPVAQEVSLQFIVDDFFLAAYLLAASNPGKFCSQEHQDLITQFRETAFHKSNKDASFAASYPLLFMPPGIDPSEPYLQCSAFLSEMIASNLFEALREQTIARCREIDKSWISALPITHSHINSMIGTELPDANFRVFITHPSLRQGAHHGSHRIAWGGIDRWENYSLVYLWHEVLHEYLGSNDVSHSIIELIADNELRVRLNGGDYPPFEGHPKLHPIKEKILPHWKEYLASTNRNIFVFEQRMKDEFKEDAKSNFWEDGYRPLAGL